MFGEAVRNCVDTPLCGVFMLNSKDGRDYCFFAVKAVPAFVLKSKYFSRATGRRYAAAARISSCGVK
ncbi:MAG: hypothetical protein ACLUFV_10690 [Acutalibacteraceae bacterium]